MSKQALIQAITSGQCKVANLTLSSNGRLILNNNVPNYNKMNSIEYKQRVICLFSKFLLDVTKLVGSEFGFQADLYHGMEAPRDKIIELLNHSIVLLDPDNKDMQNFVYGFVYGGDIHNVCVHFFDCWYARNYDEYSREDEEYYHMDELQAEELKQCDAVAEKVAQIASKYQALGLKIYGEAYDGYLHIDGLEYTGEQMGFYEGA